VKNVSNIVIRFLPRDASAERGYDL